MALPPGPKYLLNKLVSVAAPYGLVYGVIRTLKSFQVIDISRWGVILLVMALQLVVIASRPVVRFFKFRKQAAERGAVMVPEVQQSSVSIIKDVLKGFGEGYVGDVFLDWEEKYGTAYMLNIFGELRLISSEPSHMKALLATQFNEFVKGPLLQSQWKSLLGTGVFNSDGEMWKFHRNMTRPFFNKDRIRDFEIFDSHAMDTIRQIKKRLAEGHPVEFQDAVARFTLDSATEFLFGKNVRSLDAGLPYPKSSGIANSESFTNHPSTVFVNAFMKGQELTVARNRTGTTWPLAEFWGDKVAEQREIVDGFVKPILANVFAKTASGEKKTSEDEEFFLGHLINYTQDEQVILDELVNILVASRDTTAALLTFAVYVLTQRPDIAKKLREEVMKHVGPTSAPSYDDIKEMKYLRAFLNETLRLYPPVPFDARTSIGPTTIPNPNDNTRPLFVPENTNVFLIHRRKDLWGPDADEFDPNRFIDERLHKYLAPNPFIFLPFNAGPRICLGQQFAYNEASFFLVRLLQNFSSFSFAADAQDEDCKPPEQWKGAPGTKGRDKIILKAHLTMFVKGGMWIRMAA
ncbi:Protein kinase alk2 [Paramarasmius palmivorus]|uniref:Protein kinase alk2 n=1 Tax=Paramarasmius palmivorus TaxID=297713 RepID=A0AAW0CVX3_9AGAR